jgi:hypothetical protein
VYWVGGIRWDVGKFVCVLRKSGRGGGCCWEVGVGVGQVYL